MLKSFNFLITRNSSCLFNIDIRTSVGWNNPRQDQLMPKRKQAKSSRQSSGLKFVKLSPYFPPVSARNMSQSNVKLLPSPVKSARLAEMMINILNFTLTQCILVIKKTTELSSSRMV